jgi:hypothetical protein
VPEVSRDDVRELIISPYRLIYRRDSSTITMVLHERRELSGRMLARDEEVAELPRAESARTRPLQGRSPRSHEHGPAIAAILLLEPVLDANYRAVTTATWAWDRGPEGGGLRGRQSA